jgi:hypothetical protein
MISFIENFIAKKVDERINEIINDDSTLEFKNISDEKAKKEISSFILQKKQNGITKLSTLDFVLNLKLPAEQIEEVLDDFKKSKMVREINVRR